MPILVENNCDVISSDIVMEAYYGKPKEFLKIEKLLVPIIGAINAEMSSSDVSSYKLNGQLVNDSKELSEVCRLFESAFGFGNVSITFYGAGINSTGNAFNIPSSFLDIKKNIIRSKVTPKDMNLKIFVEKGLIYNYSLSPQELMAIILHEFGHTVDQSVFKLLSMTLPSISDIEHIGKSNNVVGEAISYAFAKFVAAPFIQEAYRFFMPIWYNFIEKIKSFAPIGKVINTIALLHNAILGTLNRCGFVRMLLSGKLSFKGYIAAMADPRSVFGYAGEKYSDSFATAYGYGVETATVMRKFYEGPDKLNVNKIPLLNVLNDLGRCTMGIIVAPLDPHPSSAIRVYSQLKKLRKEVKNPELPKEVVKEIESQIDKLEAICEEMTDIRANADNGMIFSAVWNNVIINGFGGIGDPRELFELIWPHDA